MSRARNWVWTLNNYTNDELTHLAVPLVADRVRYRCFQPERGENGTPHLQGFISFPSPCSLGAARLRLGLDRAHLEIARGSPAQCRAYCSKEDTRDGAALAPNGELFAFVEHGELPPAQGERTDWEHIRDDLKEGKSLEDLAETHPGHLIRYPNGMRTMQSVLRGKRKSDDPPIVRWFYGPTGSGKSRAAHDAHPDAYVKMPGNKWWDGYDQQDAVIIDDYRCDLCPFSHLLQLLDRYPYRVEMKGTSMQFCSKNIIITTPKSPQETWASRTNEDLAQLLRRITEIRYFEAVDDVVPFPGNPENVAHVV